MGKSYTKQSLITELLAIRAKGWIPSGRKKTNSGAVGNTLEDLLGIEENNLPLPNASEWELKTQRRKTSSLLTLFHMEPSPRALKLVPYLLEKYGWPHAEAGKKYPPDTKSFRQTLSFQQRSARGFLVDIDEQNRRIVINFSFDEIGEGLEDWKRSIENNNCKVFDPVYTPYWGFDDVFHNAGVKLGNCFYILADEKRIGNKNHFQYSEIKMLSGFKIEKFISAIKDGHILIDFDARTGHNHGTKFRIKQNAFPLLYEHVTTF